MNIHEFVSMSESNPFTSKSPKYRMLYIYSSQLDREYKKFNILSIIQESFSRNSNNLIIIPITGQIQLNMSPYVKIIETFLTMAINSGYSHIIID